MESAVQSFLIPFQTNLSTGRSTSANIFILKSSLFQKLYILHLIWLAEFGLQ